MDCECPATELVETRLGTVRFPIMFACRLCGQLYTCACFSGTYQVWEDIIRYLPNHGLKPESRARVEAMRERPGICHLCTGGHPELQYGHPMYYSGFLQKHLPYFSLFARLEPKPERWYTEAEFIANAQRFPNTVLASPEWRELNAFFERIRSETQEFKRRIENKTRERFGIPPIGEAWQQETHLFRLVEAMAREIPVVHHYRGKELQGLEIDIWVPAARLAVEFQGEQHFRPVDHFGGEEGFRARLESDERKRRLCKELGYHLVEFRFDEDITESTVAQRLEPYLSACVQEEADG